MAVAAALSTVNSSKAGVTPPIGSMPRCSAIHDPAEPLSLAMCGFLRTAATVSNGDDGDDDDDDDEVENDDDEDDEDQDDDERAAKRGRVIEFFKTS